MVFIFPIIGFPLSSNFFLKFFSSCVLCSLINSFVELVAYSSVIRGCCRLQHPKSSSIKITVISTYSLIYIKGFVYIIGVYHCKIFLTAYCEWRLLVYRLRGSCFCIVHHLTEYFYCIGSHTWQPPLKTETFPWFPRVAIFSFPPSFKTESIPNIYAMVPYFDMV